MKPVARQLLLILLLGLVLAGGGVAIRWRLAHSAVDWRRMRAVVFESDDWGLCGFVPTTDAWNGIDRTAMDLGRMPPVYWNSTLEDSATVTRLSGLLRQHLGRDGLPAILQPNYIMCSLAYAPGENDTLAEDSGDGAGRGTWRRYDLPDLPPGYERPGLWAAVSSAIAAGVWHPEYHGVFHYDPEIRQWNALETVAARRATERGILLFPGSSRAWELGPWRSWQTLAAELDHGLTIFAALFGRRPASLIAPDYVWDGRCERLWDSRGLHIIQAKREQRYPQWREGRLDQRLRKTVARIWSKLVYPSRIYLERNCRLEPVQTSDWVAATDRCWREIQRAWQRGQPAIVETHRINFVHLERAVVDTGFAALARLMDHLDEAAPPERPLFLVDWEVAQLQRTGTSWCPRGGLLIVRNLTDQTRVIMIPELWAERVVGPASWTGPVAGKAGRGLELGPETSIRLALASQPVAAGRPRQP